MVSSVGYAGGGYYPVEEKDNTTGKIIGGLAVAAIGAGLAYYCGRNSINAKSFLDGDELKNASIWKTVDKNGRSLTDAGKVLKSKQVMSNISTLTADKADDLSDAAKKVWNDALAVRNSNNVKQLNDLTWYEKFYNFVNETLRLGIHKKGKQALPDVVSWTAPA